jgi:hypothetical protein
MRNSHTRNPSADESNSGKALAQAGPAPLFIGYTAVGFLCFLVMAALGEVCDFCAPCQPPNDANFRRGACITVKIRG